MSHSGSLGGLPVIKAAGGRAGAFRLCIAMLRVFGSAELCNLSETCGIRTFRMAVRRSVSFGSNTSQPGLNWQMNGRWVRSLRYRAFDSEMTENLQVADLANLNQMQIASSDRTAACSSASPLYPRIISYAVAVDARVHRNAYMNPDAQADKPQVRLRALSVIGVRQRSQR